MVLFFQLLFLCILYGKKRDRLKISYSRVDIDNQYYWSFEVVNISQRNIFINNF